jgi:hypothetical protein
VCSRGRRRSRKAAAIRLLLGVSGTVQARLTPGSAAVSAPRETMLRTRQGCVAEGEVLSPKPLWRVFNDLRTTQSVVDVAWRILGLLDGLIRLCSGRSRARPPRRSLIRTSNTAETTTFWYVAAPPPGTSPRIPAHRWRPAGLPSAVSFPVHNRQVTESYIGTGRASRLSQLLDAGIGPAWFSHLFSSRVGGIARPRLT